LETHLVRGKNCPTQEPFNILVQIDEMVVLKYCPSVFVVAADAVIEIGRAAASAV
jgi:hypothetical protein